MSGKRLRVAVWWCFPCKATSGIFRELAEYEDVEVEVFLLTGMSENRERLGWHFPDYGKAKMQVLPQAAGPKQDFLDNAPLEAFDVHILNSIYVWPELNRIADRLIEKGIPFGVMTEAPFNPFKGLKRIAKNVYVRTLLVLRTYRRAAHAKFVMCLSGGAEKALRDLRRLNFPEPAIHPFGYFLEEIGLKSEARDAGQPLRLLCTGYLTENKGQELLIEALARVQTRLGPGKVELKITGFGPAEDNLKRLITALRLGGAVEMLGAVSNERLRALYDWADVFVAPGYEEPWGIRVNEAIQIGLPLIVSDGLGAAELVGYSGAGKLFRSGDVDDLVACIAKICTDPEILKEWRINTSEYRPKIRPYFPARYLHDVLRSEISGDTVTAKSTWMTPRSERAPHRKAVTG